MSQDARSALVDNYEEHFRALTQRAILAVTARHARRIFPLLVHEDPQAIYLWPILGAIRLAEHLACGGYVAPDDANEAQNAFGLKSEEHLWRDWSNVRTTNHVRATIEHVAMAARFAASAVAFEAGEIPTKQSFDEQKSIPRAAAVATLEAAAAWNAAFSPDNGLAFLVRDYKVLTKGPAGADHSGQAFTQLGGYVDPSPQGPLGPLWPNEVPSWYQESPLGRLGSSWPAGSVPADFEPTPWLQQISPRGIREFIKPDSSAQQIAELDMFVAEPEVAKLALRCRDLEHPNTAPDLTVSSRHTVPFGRPLEKHLDVVQEAIGERLFRLVTGLAAKAGLGQETPQRVLILTDQEHFAEPIEGDLVKRLGLSRRARAYPEFRAALAKNFHAWLKQHDDTRQEMRGEFDQDRFYILSPVLRCRGQRT